MFALIGAICTLFDARHQGTITNPPKVCSCPSPLPQNLWKPGRTRRDKLEGMEEIFIRDDMIRLGQFLKLANLVEDGAQAREVIQHGLVKVNGDIEEARGKQLHPGDTVSFNGVTVKVAHED